MRSRATALGAQILGLACILWLALGTFAPAPASADEEVGYIPVRQIGGPGHAALYGWGMGTALDGSVYVADYWNYRVQHLAKDGSLIGTIVPPVWDGPAKHNPPYGIAVDPRNGDLYFGDVDENATVDKWDSNGNFVSSFGSKGGNHQPLQYLYPSYLSVASDGTVFVVDSRDDDVEIVSPDGQFLGSFGTSGTGPGQFRNPRGADMDAQDRLYVADNRNNRVQVFDRTGAYLYEFGGAGTTCPAEPGHFCPGDNLRGLAVDPVNNWVYVVDAVGGYVNKFTTGGQFLQRWGGLGSAPGLFADGGRDITVDGDANVWVGDMGNFRVQKFSPNGQVLFVRPDPPQPPTPGGFTQPVGVAVDSQGNVFVADTMNQRIQKIDANGDFVTQWGQRGSDSNPYGFNYPRGVAVDPRNDDVVVCDSDNGSIKKYDNEGVHKWHRAQGLKCYSVDVGPDGRIYLANFGRYSISVLDENGNELYEIGTQGDGTFWFPRGVALDADGTLWTTDSTKRKVQHFTNDGVKLGEFGFGGTDPNQFDQPAEIEVDDTYVYVSDENTDQIKVWRKDGTFVTVLGGSGAAIGELFNPYGMDLLPGGRLYVVERSGERVQQWQLTFAGGGGGPDTLAPEGYVDTPQTNDRVSIDDVGFSGSAVDDHGVATLKVAVRNRQTGEWWRGTGWGPEFLWLNVPLDTPGQQTSTWHLDWAVPDAGDYAVQVRAEDVAGNVDPTSPFVQFSVYDGPADTIAPDGGIDAPAVNQSLPLQPATFTGPATDDIGVTGARVAVQNRDTFEWWQPGGGWAEAHAFLDATVAAPGATSTTWSYSWTPPAAGRYGINVTIGDLAGNTDLTVPYTPFSVYAGAPDPVAPTASISAPSQGAYLPGAGPITISGSAADNIGVTEVAVAVQNRDTGEWWTGSQWATAYTGHPATLANPGGTSTGWNLPWTPPAPGNYAVQATARDLAGNRTSQVPYVQFVVYPGSADTTAPDTAVTSPTGGQYLPETPATTFTGTATDNRSVTSVRLSIQDRATGSWWQPNGTWGPTATPYDASLASPGATSTGWSFTWQAPGPGSYAISVGARDLANNADPTKPFVSFTVYAGSLDATAPDTSVSAPVAGRYLPTASTTFSGAASDDRSVTAVGVSVRNTATGQWWQTAGGWGATKAVLDAQLASPGATSSSWSYTWTPPTAGTYSVVATARDLANNSDATPPTVAFVVYAGPLDDVAPDTAVTAPTPNKYLPTAATTFSGTATDNRGVRAVRVSVRNRDTGQWWQTGGGWAVTRAELSATVATPNGTSTTWTYRWTPPGAGNYAVHATARDIADTADPTEAQVDFVVYPGALDTTAPNTAVTAPTPGKALPLLPTTFSGTATDNRGVNAVAVSIRNRDDGKWWQPGGTWADTEATLAATIASPGATSTAWTLAWTPPAAANLTVRAQARDVAALVDATPASVDFSVYAGGVDTTAPNGLVSVPTPNQQIPLGPIGFTGTATDNVGVGSAKVAIKNVAQNKWWTGSAWGAFTWLTASVAAPGSPSTTWSYAWTPPAVGSYQFQVKVFDSAGNGDPSVPFVGFTVYSGTLDTVAPETVVTVPASNQQFPRAPITFSGTGTDNVALAGVRVAIKNVAQNKWWTGTAWGAFTWLDATMASPGATSSAWTYSWTPPAGGNYVLQAAARDESNNVDPTKPWITFSVST